MDQRFRLRNGGLEWRTVEGEVVALDLPAETYLGVNRSGSLLWRALADGATREELVRRLITEYGVDRPDAERDVDGFVAALQERGLLEADSG